MEIEEDLSVVEGSVVEETTVHSGSSPLPVDLISGYPADVVQEDYFKRHQSGDWSGLVELSSSSSTPPLPICPPHTWTVPRASPYSLAQRHYRSKPPSSGSSDSY